MRPVNSCRPCSSLGVSAGTRVGVLSANRPEVLHVGHAVQLLAGINIPMHPLSGVADHLHVITDAQIEILIFDATRYQRTRGRARRTASRVCGSSRSAQARLPKIMCKLAERFTPARLVAPRVGPHDVQRLGYSGGTTGKPKSLASVHRTGLVTLSDHDGGVGMAEPAARVVMHAAQSCRRCDVHADVAEERDDARAAELRAGRGDAGDCGASHQLHDARADDDLRAARSSALRRVRSVSRSRRCSTARLPSRRRD